MSALWHTAKRGGQGPDGRRNTSWEHCALSNCTGRSLREVHDSGPDRCYAHADADARGAALTTMNTQHCVDLRGTVLDEQAVQEIFAAVTSAEKYYFRACTFTGESPFPGHLLRVQLRSDHEGFIQPGVVDFGQATFQGGADFRKTTFPGPVFFDDTRFDGPLFLDRAHFRGEVWFLRTAMYEGHFTETVFDSLAGFHKVYAASSLDFTGSVFSSRADFDHVRAMTIDFSDATFVKRTVMLLGGAAYLRDKDWWREENYPQRECVFIDTQFNLGLELRLQDKIGAVLRRTHFGASSTVSTPSNLVTPAPPLGGLSDEGRPSAVLSLQDTDVEKLSLVSVDLSECLFAGALNLDKLRLSGTIRFACLPRQGFRTWWNWPLVWRWSRRDIIHEELQWRADLAWRRVGHISQEAAKNIQRVFGTTMDHTITDAHLASIYRSLRKAREDAKDEPGAGDFYYGEMEARRHSSPPLSGDRLLLSIYWALSGYGQRASRALAALAVLMGALTILLAGYGLADTAPIQRITDTARTTAPPPPQVITVDLTGQRATVTIPPPATPPAALDVTTVAPTLPPPDQRWTETRFQRAISTLVTSLVPISTDQRLTAFGGYVVLAGRVLGAVLLGLAVLAIRARVKR